MARLRIRPALKATYHAQSKYAVLVKSSGGNFVKAGAKIIKAGRRRVRK